MTHTKGACATAAVLALLVHSQAANAQRATENAVTSADDAFGSNVGLESIGIYSENDTRGFSPIKAGNARIDGVYFDPVGPMSGRLRASTAIRVGFASEDFPFHAPTGVVDHKFRPFPAEIGTSLGVTRNGFGGTIAEWDLRLRNRSGSAALTGGLAFADNRFSDGSRSLSWGTAWRPIFRVAGAEIAPFAAYGRFFSVEPRGLVVVTGDFLPKIPGKRRYLGQEWAEGKSHNEFYGVTAKARLTDNLSFRGGLFHGIGDRVATYSEIFTLLDPSGLASHRLISDPPQDLHSTSGEAQIVWRLGNARWQHRIFAGYRARDRYTESGGSDRATGDFDPVIFGDIDRGEKPAFTYFPVDKGRLRQSSLMLGYIGNFEGVGSVNLGIQKARYRSVSRDGDTGAKSTSRDNPWLYNATATLQLSKTLSLYAGTERGLEDSGVAPETATNHNEQLPATRTTQYEGGLRWKRRGTQLVVSAFEINKPYFAFDAASAFTEVGDVRHRGVEASLSGHFGKRLNLLAGAVLMRPRVTGPGRESGDVGARPAGTPSVFARLDANYRTDIFGGLTPTLALTYTGRRAVGSRPLDASGRQLMVPGFASLDLGVRQQFKLGAVPMSFRAVAYNVFDDKTWKVVAPNTMYVDDRRRYSVTLTADF